MNSPVTDFELRQFCTRMGFALREADHAGDSHAYSFARALRDYMQHRLQDSHESLESVWKESVPWSDATFPQSTPQSIAAHLLDEARELAENPYDGKEIADIALLLGHLASRVEVNVAAEARAKFNINQGRTWGEPNEKGFVEHVRQEGEQKEAKRPTIEVDALWHETVYEVSNGRKTGRTGKALHYRIGGRTFAKEPVWDDEPQAAEV